MKVPSTYAASGRARISGAAIGVAFLACAAIFFSFSSRTANAQHLRKVAHPRFEALRIGEVLNYQVSWRGFAAAAAAQLQIVNRGEFFGRESWHFRAALHTEAPFRALYSFDDVIDSYPLAANLLGREFQEHRLEFGKPEEDAEWLVEPGKPANAPLPHVIVPAGTMDALSAIYFLRSVNWNETPEIRVPVFDGENIYEMHARREERSAVYVSTEKYQATKISIRLFDAGKDIGEHFELWLADDGRRTPVFCTAELPVGMVRIELTVASGAAKAERSGELTPAAHSSHRAGN